jgi:hypothetical protein
LFDSGEQSQFNFHITAKNWGVGILKLHYLHLFAPIEKELLLECNVDWACWNTQFLKFMLGKWEELGVSECLETITSGMSD